MGVSTETIKTVTCDMCGEKCKESDGVIGMQTDAGDRDVGPGSFHGKVYYSKAYVCSNGVVCKQCKLSWLKRYVAKLEKE